MIWSEQVRIMHPTCTAREYVSRGSCPQIVLGHSITFSRGHFIHGLGCFPFNPFRSQICIDGYWSNYRPWNGLSSRRKHNVRKMGGGGAPPLPNSRLRRQLGQCAPPPTHPGPSSPTGRLNGTEIPEFSCLDCVMSSYFKPEIEISNFLCRSYNVRHLNLAQFRKIFSLLEVTGWSWSKLSCCFHLDNLAMWCPHTASPRLRC